MSLADHTGNDCEDSNFSLMGDYFQASYVPVVPCNLGPGAADLATVRCTVYALCVDSDGDGYDDGEESYLSTNPFDRCDAAVSPFPSGSWPSDLSRVGFSAGRVNLLDLVSFFNPVRRFNTTPEPNTPGIRWDLEPGGFGGAAHINVQDMAALLAGAKGYPPMFGGDTRAFDAPDYCIEA
jgi:hypothetical protein